METQISKYNNQNLIIHHSSFIIHHSSFIIHHSSFIIHHSSFIINHLSLTTPTLALIEMVTPQLASEGGGLERRRALARGVEMDSRN
ncbi:hypothetical protein [Chryseobacterium cucumeris]|uniref:hypothetical protein n=1 Tax=Chryseobacterium cucumeris TaxID=1813611 RepID=UPI0023F13904|nr:hypothetical protein [Chryseobacterium cucumeris]